MTSIKMLTCLAMEAKAFEFREFLIRNEVFPIMAAVLADMVSRNKMLKKLASRN